mmetsp:Transcript_22859/g.32757  ORF Transcript_22859/g.32757 Transcript_22859/m.32757 type:complete len:660 (+) Transcript_22859:99-2078(+)|eukprot:CAMPEP_0172421058 /NCGR_PEP_ID=MMETSP1064-20121228/7338_1 /TAXON_ID=202472 /ORGANISM="Aulacoseira subarctica , Strain CCAP 1002/5" /LENGTH=659 /DNA_ID=CAMNT_0013161275 /DNA_START=42 /DNA_END=2021 /DNA_ORIENTATION=+
MSSVTDWSSISIKLRIGNHVRRIPVQRLTDGGVNPSFSALKNITLLFYLEQVKVHPTPNLSTNFKISFSYLDEENESIVFSTSVEFLEALRFSSVVTPSDVINTSPTLIRFLRVVAVIKASDDASISHLLTADSNICGTSDAAAQQHEFFKENTLQSAENQGASSRTSDLTLCEGTTPVAVDAIYGKHLASDYLAYFDRGFLHSRHTCDGCGKTPIIGIRYHALNIPDFDFCEICMANYGGLAGIIFQPEQLACDKHFQSRCIRKNSDEEYTTSDLIDLSDPAAVQTTEGFIEVNNNGLVKAIDVLGIRAAQSAQSGLIVGSDVEEIKEEINPEAVHRVSDTADQLACDEDLKLLAHLAKIDTKMTSPNFEICKFIRVAKGRNKCLSYSNEDYTENLIDLSEPESQKAGEAFEAYNNNVANAINVIGMGIAQTAIIIGLVVNDIINEKTTEAASEPNVDNQPTMDEKVRYLEVNASESFVQNSAESLNEPSRGLEDGKFLATHEKQLMQKERFSSAKNIADNEWDLVDSASDVMVAVGSALYQEDLFRSNDKIPQTSDVIAEDDSSENYVDVMSVSSVNSIGSEEFEGASSNEATINAFVLARWDEELRELRSLGFADDWKSLEALESLEAADIGVDSDDVVSVNKAANWLLDRAEKKV